MHQRHIGEEQQLEQQLPRPPGSFGNVPGQVLRADTPARAKTSDTSSDETEAERGHTALASLTENIFIPPAGSSLAACSRRLSASTAPSAAANGKRRRAAGGPSAQRCLLGSSRESAACRHWLPPPPPGGRPLGRELGCSGAAARRRRRQTADRTGPDRTAGAAAPPPPPSCEIAVFPERRQRRVAGVGLSRVQGRPARPPRSPVGLQPEGTAFLFGLSNQRKTSFSSDFGGRRSPERLQTRRDGTAGKVLLKWHTQMPRSPKRKQKNHLKEQSIKGNLEEGRSVADMKKTSCDNENWMNIHKMMLQFLTCSCCSSCGSC
ncbi:uncharacterized protein LOC134136597 [Rhea pennata]|uniref:uncharacterized protein LOC134136597 n=1 Tax=Rhea pennata TaxID=8795 RepID=UPI002E2646ED